MLSFGHCFVVLTLLIVFLTQAYGLPSVNPIHDIQPEKTLAAHNEIRAAVGVAPLVWNETVAAYAQNYANEQAKGGKCTMPYSGGPYGENVAGGWVLKDHMSGPVATNFWGTEKANYDHATNKCTDVCDHYTQIVAKQSTSLGCGSYRCHNNELIWFVCHYYPKGDANARPY